MIPRLCLAASLMFLAAASLSAQTSDAKAQEDFALAVAKAHARTSLFGEGAKPFAIHATATSYLALRGTGEGTYDNRYIDSRHWQRSLRFPDYEMTEMRNDSGHSWIDPAAKAAPIRAAELLRFVLIHVPSSTRAADYTVTESSSVGESGEPLTCYAASRPAEADGFPRQFRWCFDTASGVLVSEEMPLDLHIDFGNYITFQGKQEYTQVHVRSGKLPNLDLQISYAALDAHALDSLKPSETMQRSGSAGSEPNPEEWQHGNAQYRAIPPLPSGTPKDAADQPVELRFQIGTDGKVFDAAVEQAPTQAMAQSALKAASEYIFTPFKVDNKPVNIVFFGTVWFQPEDERESAGAYFSPKLGFAFHFPKDFVIVPPGQLEADARYIASKQKSPESELRPKCNAITFRAQRLIPGSHFPQMLSILDPDPECIDAPLDRRTLDIVAVNAAHSVADHWSDPDFSKPKFYKTQGRSFAVISASGIPHDTVAEPHRLLMIVTILQNRVVGWMLEGPGDAPGDNLEQILEACTLQIGAEPENALLPPKVKP